MRAWVVAVFGAVPATSGCSEHTHGSSDGPTMMSAAGRTTSMVVASPGASSAPEPAPHTAVLCADPTPRPGGGGYTLCGDGSLRRTAAGTCDSHLPRPPSDQTPV